MRFSAAWRKKERLQFMSTSLKVRGRRPGLKIDALRPFSHMMAFMKISRRFCVLLPAIRVLSAVSLLAIEPDVFRTRLSAKRLLSPSGAPPTGPDQHSHDN